MGIGVSIDNAFNTYTIQEDGSVIDSLTFTDQNGTVFGRLFRPFLPFQTFTVFNTFPTSFRVTATLSLPNVRLIPPVVSNVIGIDGTAYSLQLSPGAGLALSSQNQEFVPSTGVLVRVDPSVIANFQTPLIITTPTIVIQLDTIPSVFNIPAKLGDAVSIVLTPNKPVQNLSIGVTNTLIIAKPTINLITTKSLSKDTPLAVVLVQGELNPTPVPRPCPTFNTSAVIILKNCCKPRRCKKVKRIT